ncbi:MAG: HAD family hydrolase [Dehalococcoidia bacterium]
MYKTAAYDMDGVLLRSNGLKSAAFHSAALPYGEPAAAAMVALHRAAGSISRRERVERFFLAVLGREPKQREVDAMVQEIGAQLTDAYRAVPYLAEIKSRIEMQAADGVKVVVVTGVEESEARRILEARSVCVLLDGIYGGPPVKRERLRQLIEQGAIEPPAVYFGDTLDDYEAAHANGLDFVLVTPDAEWDWRPWLATDPAGVVAVIEELPLPRWAVPA